MGSSSLNKRENERDSLSGRGISLVISTAILVLAVKEKPTPKSGAGCPTRFALGEGMVGDVLFHRNGAEQTVPALLLSLPTLGSVGNLVLLLISIQKRCLHQEVFIV